MAKVKYFKKGEYVRYTNGKTNTIGCITQIKDNLCRVNDTWYKKDDLVHYKLGKYQPTDEQMKIIKKEYPLFSKKDILIIRETTTTFVFHYNKNNQRGYVHVIGTNFYPITEKKAVELSIY